MKERNLRFCIYPLSIGGRKDVRMVTVYTYDDYERDNKKNAAKKRNRPVFDRQLATAYILYMMLGSEYHRTVFTDKGEESRLYGQYKKMGEGAQYQFEDRILKKLSKIAAVPEREKLNCMVSGHFEGKGYWLFFRTYFGEVEFQIKKDGRFTTNVYLRKEVAA